MKSLLTITTLIALLGTGCNQQQDPFSVKAEAKEPSAPDPRADKMWGHDLSAARARAHENGKLVLLDFTGSDWCPPCMALHDFVFTQPEFLDFAEKNLKKQLHKASESGVDYVLLIAPNEIAQSEIICRDMNSRTETKVSVSNIADYVMKLSSHNQ